MSVIEGRFQYFYCTGSLSGLPYPDVPTRDVTNTQGAGYKTEPHLELRLENWCRCRARFVTPAAKRGLSMAADGGQHYLLLTTRQPHTGDPFVVGLMPFSKKAFNGVLQKYPGRWSNDTFLPYVSGEQGKVVAFADAFPLSGWMKDEEVHTIPGGQGGRGCVPKDLLENVVKHFATKLDQTKAFLENVRALEKQLKGTKLPQWQKYQSCLPSGHSCPAAASSNC